MLASLTIRNFVIVRELDLEFGPGMTAVTGETGAGKSILLAALDLALGGRARSDQVRPGSGRLEVYAAFEPDAGSAVRTWLAEREFDDDGECILGRTVSAEGRSRAFVNGRPVTVADLRELGGLLLDIHGQHEHHGLLGRAVQRDLLDGSAGIGALAAETGELANAWRAARQELDRLRGEPAAAEARRDLLRYQVQELDQLDLGADEIDALDREHRALSGMSDTLTRCRQARELLAGDADATALDLLGQARACLATIDTAAYPGLGSALAGMDAACVQAEEASRELERCLDQLELDPERLARVEERLAAIQEVARKHHVLGSRLADRHTELKEELAALENQDAHLLELERRCGELADAYDTSAARLTAARGEAAARLAAAVEGRLADLGLAGGRFEVQLQPVNTDQPTAGGRETCEFLVSLNPGQPLQPMARVASGGELARIGLAIRVVTAERASTPTLLFDEVDTGVGGATAEIVGRQLRDLAAHAQVICITHLPQVASLAGHHFRVRKQADEAETNTRIEPLPDSERVAEIARMLGGLDITEETRAHARRMLEDAASPVDPALA